MLSELGAIARMYPSAIGTVRVSLALLDVVPPSRRRSVGCLSVKMTACRACCIRLSEDKQLKCWFFEQ